MRNENAQLNVPYDHEALYTRNQFFAKNEKVETGNLLAKLISMKYKDKGNIREYIMKVSNLIAKLKSLKLELDEDLIVYLILISLPTHFGRINGPSMSLYLTMCKRKRGCRDIRLKVLIFLRPLRIRKERTLRIEGVERVKDVFELIHTNIYDDCFRYSYLYLIHEKSQPLDVFKSFKDEVELQLGKKIKVIKFDRGGEQRSRPSALFLKECGIVL
ncbi:hypothetical protein CR513_11098, partial [Mucuna pruriens]